MYRILFLLSLSFSIFQQGIAQSILLKGAVYDHYTKQPLQAVTVYGTNGNIAICDSTGRYTIKLGEKDSVWFSYLFKQTIKYPIDTIVDLENFDIALYVDAAWLPEVRVRNKNYTLDSINNRRDYAKIFDFKKPGLSFSTASPSSYVPGALTAGIDLVELINMFRFRRNRQILNMQDRLLWEEREKYIDHRYSKLFVRRLTGLEMPALDSFMNLYRPDYYTLQEWNEIELGNYIQKCYQNYLYLKQKGELDRMYR